MLARGTNPPKDSYEVKLKLAPGSLAAVRLETLPHESLPQKGSARADDGNFRLSEFEAEIVYPGTNTPSRRKSNSRRRWPTRRRPATKSRSAIDAKPETGWQADTNGVTEPHAALFLPADPITVKIERDADGAAALTRLRTSKRAIGHFRLSAAQNEELVQLLAPPKAEPWQVLGPFKTESTQQGFTNVFEPEKEMDLKKTYAGVRDEIKWNAKPDFEDGKANLLVQDLHGIHGAYYLYRTMKLPARAQDRIERARRRPVQALGQRQAGGRTRDEGKGRRGSDEGRGEFARRARTNSAQGRHDAGRGLLHFQEGSDDERTRCPRTSPRFSPPRTNFNAPQQTKMRNVYRRLHSPEFKQMFENVEKWTRGKRRHRKPFPPTMVAKEMEKPRDTFMLIRGEYDKKGDKVGARRAVDSAAVARRRSRRTGSASRGGSLHPDHPLTARVTVNRFWQQYFGTGW